MGILEFQTTMTKLTLVITFWLLIGVATVLGTPVDPNQLRVNVKVNIGRKTAEPNQLKPRTVEDSTFDLKIQELAEKAEKGIPAESEGKELAEEAKKNAKMMTKLKGFVQEGLKELTGVDKNFDLKIQELAVKAERAIPVESEVKELIEEAKKNPKMLKKRLFSFFLGLIIGSV